MMGRFLLAVALLLAHNGAAHAVLTVGGVTVTNNPMDPNYAALTTNAIEPADVNAMIASTDTFAFLTVAHARQHFGIRYGISGAINRMAPGVGINFDYPGNAGPSYPNDADHDYFVGTGADDSINTFSFKVKPNVKASDAIFQIDSAANATRSDCRAAACTAILIGHLDELKAPWIDAKIAAGALVIGKAFYFMGGPNTDKNTVIEGDRRYMSNDTRYFDAALKNTTLKPRLTTETAIWNGEHTIYVGGGKYSGLGQHNNTEDALRLVLRTALSDDANIQLTNVEATANIIWTVLERPTIFP